VEKVGGSCEDRTEKYRFKSVESQNFHEQKRKTVFEIFSVLYCTFKIIVQYVLSIFKYLATYWSTVQKKYSCIRRMHQWLFNLRLRALDLNILYVHKTVHSVKKEKKEEEMN
jgi:hypothetical protein